MESVTSNPYFDTMDFWCCQSDGDPKCSLMLCESSSFPGISPPVSEHYVIQKGRKQTWNGVAQRISGKLKSNTTYSVQSHVRILGADEATILGTMCLKDESNKYWSQNPFRQFARVNATNKEWSILEGKISAMTTVPPEVVVYIEGAAAGIDLLVGSFTIFPVAEKEKDPLPSYSPPDKSVYGVNIIENGDFSSGVDKWKGMTGSEKMVVFPSSPIGNPLGPPYEPSFLPLSGSESRNPVLSGPTGAYLVVSNRKAYWQGPKQEITSRVIPFVTYAVYAWVRVGISDLSAFSSTQSSSESSKLLDDILGRGFSQDVNFALSVNDRWVNGGAAEAVSFEWRRLYGSFRIEEKVNRVTVYVQGPSPGVDIWIADIRVMAVDSLARREELKAKAEKIRKRDVEIRVVDSAGRPITGALVKVKQIQRKFPLGSCINSRDFNNPQYLDFFLKHFNFAVFENEFKWTSMERKKGEVHYELVDKMLNWAEMHNIKCRAHCLFWDNSVPEWVKELSDEDLASAIDLRIVEVMSRYRGRFVNYDVNNEMLHGGYFANRLGIGTVVRMFQLANRMDENAALFLNDYNVEDGKDAKSSPEKYISHARNLLSRDAPVGGIGLQGHAYAPVGLNIRHSLDLISTVGLPVWFTEVDVPSLHDAVRADDLEIMLREGFAHDAVEGIMLWGFWEGGDSGPAMSRKNAYLVNSDWTLNKCGERLESLISEWTTPDLQGFCDADGLFRFSGFFGLYRVWVESNGAVHQAEFNLDRSPRLDYPCVVSLSF